MDVSTWIRTSRGYQKNKEKEKNSEKYLWCAWDSNPHTIMHGGINWNLTLYILSYEASDTFKANNLKYEQI